MPLLAFLGDWAIPTLLDIGLVAVSLVFLLLVYAGDILFATPLRLLAGFIPFIGNQIADGISSITGGIKSWAANWAGDNVRGLVRLVVIIPQMVVAIVGTIVGAFEWVIGQIVGLATAIAQTAASLVWNVAIISLTLVEHSGLINLLQTAASDVANTTSWVYKTFVPAQIQTALAQAKQMIDAAIAAAVAGVQTDIKDAIAGVQTDIADVRAGVETDIADVRAGIETDIADVRAGIETDIADAASAVVTAIEQALGIDGIFAVIGLTTLIFQHPDEAAREVAAASEQLYHIADPLIEVLHGQRTAVGIGKIIWPPAGSSPAPTPPPHGQ